MDNNPIPRFFLRTVRELAETAKAPHWTVMYAIRSRKIEPDVISGRAQMFGVTKSREIIELVQSILNRPARGRSAERLKRRAARKTKAAPKKKRKA